MTAEQVHNFYNKHNANIVISLMFAFIGAILGTIFTIIYSILTDDFHSRIIIEASIGLIVVVLLLALLLNIKRLLFNYFSNLTFHLIPKNRDDLFEKDKYWERLSHFTTEKNKLADILVHRTLPEIIQTICRENPNIETLNIILDSGTTITPIFTLLSKCGILNTSENIEYKIYTNNLAGIDELLSKRNHPCQINPREFNLIGGQPLNLYRATTGESTLRFLDTIWSAQDKESNNGRIITLGILTSNWFMCGVDFKKISICAKGAGHLKFKRKVIENSHYSILLSPLGKLLPIDNLELLNRVVREDSENDVPLENSDMEYRSFTIPNEKKDRIYLLTSLRDTNSPSPLLPTSICLKDTVTNNKNYTLRDECPPFGPEGDLYSIVVSELPHLYIRKNFSDIFHRPLSSYFLPNP